MSQIIWFIKNLEFEQCNKGIIITMFISEIFTLIHGTVMNFFFKKDNCYTVSFRVLTAIHKNDTSVPPMRPFHYQNSLIL